MLAWAMQRSYVRGHGAGAQAETPWVHYTFYVELILGHCTFRNLSLLPNFFMIPVM